MNWSGGIYRGRLKGKTKSKSSWTNYNVLIQDGMLKLYKGKVLKGDYDLAGTVYEQISISPLSLTLSMANQQKTIITLLAEDEAEIQKFVEALSCGIYQKNVSALSNGLRTPQVIEWFFQKQGEFREYEPNLKLKHKFLMKQGPAHFEYSLPIINSSLSGLSVEVEGESANPSHPLELIHTILFREMTSVRKQFSDSIPGNNILPTEVVIVVSPSETKTQENSPEASEIIPHDPQSAPELQFSYVFGCFPVLSELGNDSEEIGFQEKMQGERYSISLQGGVGEEDYLDEWLTGLHIAQAFCVIPSPVQNLIDPSSLHFGGNSKTSNGQFVVSSDIIILIRSLESYYKQIPSLQSLSNEIQFVFNLLSQVQCNRDAACCFGHRLEEIIRIIANPRHGILRVSLISYHGTLQSHFLTLTQKIIEIKNFIHSLTVPGWLSLTLHGQLHNQRSRFNRLLSSESSIDLPYLRIKYEEYDRDLMMIMNRIMRDFPQITWNESSSPYSYDMILDIVDTIDSYGGMKKIKSDYSKIKAISRLIQCSEVELEIELKQLAPSMKRRVCQNIFCCCLNQTVTSNPSKPESNDESEKSIHRRSQSKRTVSADLSEGLLSDTSSYGAKAGDVDFFQPSLREENKVNN